MRSESFGRREAGLVGGLFGELDMDEGEGFRHCGLRVRSEAAEDCGAMLKIGVSSADLYISPPPRA